MANETEPQEMPPDPTPIPPGQITRAFDYGSFIELVVVYTGQTEMVPFTLTADDHYGFSDAWRTEYQRAIAAGEITLELPPQPKSPPT
ncbi:hypothetical protein [Sinorhizobium meliloti]|uniref:hypothetical protein n=1 Tax=Rhizobium meliloti TaxID=382 RepID=UPI000FD987C6|nr:hypothetical protein [Sinorhizobium meliloti]MDX0213909.1 hypothetical protein [Sinorhizobium meliloti]RVM24157.1 hypothetical protein CN132_21555 [Sinorhizobium meliloti]